MADVHAFSTKVACSLGVPGAIVLQHFLFLQQSAAGADGDIFGLWVKRSARAIAVTYPYWNAKQIHHILSTLEADAVLASKIENDYPGDRTKSYTITKKGFEILGIDHFQKKEMVFKNGKSDVQKKEMHIGYNSYSFSSSSAGAENSTSLEAENTHNRVDTPPPPAQNSPAFGVDIDREAARLRADPMAKELFQRRDKIPGRFFEEYIDLFVLEAKGREEKYANPARFREHFFSYSGRRFQINGSGAPKPQPATQRGAPAPLPSVQPKNLLEL